MHYYYIPISKVEGWDGFVLWLKLSEDQVKKNYEKHRPPNPSLYYTKDPPTTYDATLEGPTVIIPKWTRPIYTTATHASQPDSCDLRYTFQNRARIIKPCKYLALILEVAYDKLMLLSSLIFFVLQLVNIKNKLSHLNSFVI